MTECRPVPCPDFQEVEITIGAICDCSETVDTWKPRGLPGSPDCPLDGQRVQGYIHGWNAASDAFERAARQVINK